MKKFIDDLYKEHNDKVDTEVLINFKIMFNSGDDISIPLIQRKCRCGYFSASRVLQKLIEDGKVKEGKTSSSICKVI